MLKNLLLLNNNYSVAGTSVGKGRFFPTIPALESLRLSSNAP